MSAEALLRRVQALQREARLPQLSMALAREGEVVATAGAGDPAPGQDVAFRIGSITKTFTAVLVMQLRDERAVALGDPVGRRVPGLPARVGAATLRDLLCHRSGLRREPAGPVAQKVPLSPSDRQRGTFCATSGPFWEASPGPDADGLLAYAPDDAIVLPPGERWHYSNLAYALLGRVVEECRAAPFPDVLAQRLLRPLQLDRTTWLPRDPYAHGWHVHPFADTATPEPHADTRAMGPAGQLWSTPSDLCRWGAFLADPDPDLLAPATAEEMRRVAAVVDDAWTAGQGLGLQLYRRGERVLAGHGGSMPGFVAGLVFDARERVVASACGNAWQGADMPSLAADLVVAEAERAPRTVPWAPADVPAELAELVGPWYHRGAPFPVRFADGHLVVGARREDRFVPDGPDRYRGIDPWQAGEALQVLRDDAGVAVVLDMGGWLLTRTPDDPRGGP